MKSNFCTYGIASSLNMIYMKVLCPYYTVEQFTRKHSYALILDSVLICVCWNYILIWNYPCHFIIFKVLVSFCSLPFELLL